MKELKAFTESELQILKETLEKASGLLFPDDATRFGALKFRFYSAAKANEYHFQIFWDRTKSFPVNTFRARIKTNCCGICNWP
ncbi:hypothetical protein ACX8XN_01185 [Calditrichota bacterium GD2]